jgi:hypothetical protein
MKSAYSLLFVALTIPVAFSGCGSESGASNPAGSAQPGQESRLASDPLVISVPDQCGIETYVGPNHGYESEFVRDGVWSQDSSFESGMFSDLVSGYSGRSTQPGGLAAVDPRCGQLLRIFTASPVTDEAHDVRSYYLALNFHAEAEPFPRSLAEARETSSLEARITAKLQIEMRQPCDSSVGSSGECQETINNSAQTFPVEFHCQTSSTLKRIVAAAELTDEYEQAYSLPNPDQCVFRLNGATIRLADGTQIQASISGTAATEQTGPRLRILRISLGQ